ncbi:ABC transporter ATP-binding protein [Tessaracoccus rhinocerotis]|uniref:ABC transporter ATP-binding protein n=1 Tax=Tessaracoccus rhinocerotis TaxID=1689449 RepID=A0A553K0F0_9ACTN|nr:ABC transporter ATP-binding protein [Tessaracoccus rhinocerotis]TRY18181.1 ABC transporter ATP-binding protein [Tessaracoccus rhinocerotis]
MIRTTPSHQPVIAVRGLRKAFGPKVAVADVSFAVDAGEIFGLLGPNGAGKTTTVECISGMLESDDGGISVLGRHPSQEGTVLRSLVGYQMQTSALPSTLRVEEALRVFASFYPKPAAVPELLDTVGLTHRRKAAFSALSGGERQRLSIALALIGNPRVAILDELTTGLDPQGRRDVWALVERIRASGITVLLVSHFLDEVERLCDRLAIIADGRTIFDGTPEHLIARAAEANPEIDNLEDAYLALVDANQTHYEGASA